VAVGAPAGSCAAVAEDLPCVVLAVRIANLVEAIVVEGGVARTSPAAATRILAAAVSAEPIAVDAVCFGTPSMPPFRSFDHDWRLFRTRAGAPVIAIVSLDV